MSKTVLVIGDEIDWESYLKFKRTKSIFNEKGVVFKTASYGAVIRRDFPKIRSKEIMVVPFFPLRYWNTRIEKGLNNGRVYGDGLCGAKFSSYMARVGHVLREGYSGKDLTFLINPEGALLDRDKWWTKAHLQMKSIPVPREYETRDVEDVKEILKEHDLYVKVRYGAMGKGITRLRKNEWLTNFIYKGRKIINRNGDYGWEFQDVTGREDFLRKLLSKDVVLEQAVDSCIVNGKKFDIRFYVLYGKVRHWLIRSSNPNNVLTNITQGGFREPRRFLNGLPWHWVDKAEMCAEMSADALGLKIAGVDVMISKSGEPYVLEVQSFPGFPKKRYRFAERMAKDILHHWDL